MPDITIPNTFADGAVADAEQVSENTYLPKVSPDNPSVMNGDLTNPNRDGWTINSQDVRRDHFSKSTMVSATANQDFFNDLYLGQSNSTFPYSLEWWKEAQVIPGCAVTFYTPAIITAVSLTWHVSLVIDANVQDVNNGNKTIKSYSGAAADNYSLAGLSKPYYDLGKARLILFINDLPVFPMQRILLNGAASMSYDPTNPERYQNHYYGPDTRDWSASFVWDENMLSQNPNFDLTKAPIYRGWHTADLRLILPPYDEQASPATTDGTGGVRQVRVKSRRMGYTLIR
tara:strand:+ start:661 stop:1521 length:861 start_codon:yes stop_codon:yes gene_type:complete